MRAHVRHEPEQSPDAAMLPLLPRAASAGPGLHPPVADWRVSGRLPDAMPALEVFRERAVHEGVESCVEINQLRAQRRVDGVRASEV